MVRLCVFFFQAEDGIRDGHVTGVQTCALPIWRGPSRAAGGGSACPLHGRSVLVADLGGRASDRAIDERSEERRVGKECRARRTGEDGEKRRGGSARTRARGGHPARRATVATHG